MAGEARSVGFSLPSHLIKPSPENRHYNPAPSQETETGRQYQKSIHGKPYQDPSKSGSGTIREEYEPGEPSKLQRGSLYE